jgi:glycogen synthase
MRIALVNRCFPPHTGYGGISVYNFNLSRALAKLGHQVTVIAARWSAEVPESEESGGVRIIRILAGHSSWVHRLPVIGKYARGLEQLFYSFRIALKLSELEKKSGLDVIEFAEVEAEGFVYLLRKKRSPVIVRCHTPTFILKNYFSKKEMPRDTSLVVKMEKSCIHRADLLTAPSHDMGRIIAEECGIVKERIKVIPNLLDQEQFLYGSKERSKEVKVLCVGRLERTKGVAMLEEAIPVILKKAPGLKFIMIGDDSADENGMSWAKRLSEHFKTEGIQERVLILGGVDRETLINWYKRADMAVVPSLLYESFSYTCAQAMAAGIPVVASRIGGIPETLDEGRCGILIEPGQVPELTQAVLRLAEDQPLRNRMGSAGFERAKNNFDPELVAKKVLQMVEERSCL